MHGLDSNIPVLRRWAHHSPEKPLPQDWGAFKAANAKEAIEIEQADPELVSLLEGTAPAGLRADVLQGKFSSSAPDQAALKKAEQQSTIQQLVASKPWADGRCVHLTNALMLEELAPDIARNERKKAGFQNPDDRDAAIKAEHEASARRLRQMEIDGMRRRLQTTSY